MTENRERGVAFQEWWLSCGVCGREESMGLENNRAALQEGRNRGWVRNRRYGWTCPDDAARLGFNSRGVRPHTFDNPRRDADERGELHP